MPQLAGMGVHPPYHSETFTWAVGRANMNQPTTGGSLIDMETVPRGKDLAALLNEDQVRVETARRRQSDMWKGKNLMSEPSIE